MGYQPSAEIGTFTHLTFSPLSHAKFTYLYLPVPLTTLRMEPPENSHHHHQASRCLDWFSTTFLWVETRGVRWGSCQNSRAAILWHHSIFIEPVPKFLNCMIRGIVLHQYKTRLVNSENFIFQYWEVRLGRITPAPGLRVARRIVEFWVLHTPKEAQIMILMFLLFSYGCIMSLSHFWLGARKTHVRLLTMPRSTERLSNHVTLAWPSQFKNSYFNAHAWHLVATSSVKSGHF